MLNQAVSGFEPLFFLHHTNMDRLWAYWQAIHPEEATLSSSYRGRPRYRSPAGATITPDSPLDPFRGKDGKPYTPKSVASILDFGYSYEGLDGNKSEDERKDEATRLINRLYSGNAPEAPPPRPGNPNNNGGPRTNGTRPESPGRNGRPGGNGTRPGSPPSGVPNSPRPGSPPSGNGPRPTLLPPSGIPKGPNGKPPSPGSVGAVGGERHSCQIELDVEQVERPCFVSVYIGDVLAGSVTVMSHPATGVANFAIFLDSAIEQWGSQPKNGTLGDFNDSINVDITKVCCVANFLIRILKLTIISTKPDGNKIGLESVSSLKIAIDKVNVKAPTSDDKFPEIEAKPLPPVNGGRELTPPPASAHEKSGPEFEGTSGSTPAGQNIGGGSSKDNGQKPCKGPKSTAARSSSLTPLFCISSALVAILSTCVLL